MKILAIAPYKFLPAENGGQKAIEGLYSSLSKYVELACASTANNDLQTDHGFEVIPVFNNSKLRYVDLFAVRSLVNFIRNRGITHVLTEHPYMGWLAIKLREKTGAKFIIHSHNIEGERFKSIGKWFAPFLSRYEKKMHASADLSLFITEEDRDYAIQNWGLDKEKTFVTPFAVQMSDTPSFEKKYKTKALICERHQIPSDRKLLAFAGAFTYVPNQEGLQHLLVDILPLLDQKGFPYHLIVCGKNIPDNLVVQNDRITYTGFVENINEYYTAADVFVNPMTSGGGIKTKLVEALGNNCSAVSTVTGAIGIPASICAQKLKRVPNESWETFADAIITSENSSDTPTAFFDYFNADKIAVRTLRAIESL